MLINFVNSSSIDVSSASSSRGSSNTLSTTPSAALTAPLADVVRPTVIEDFVGQEDVIGQNSFLRTILQTGDVPSLIFWGPPGCGKVS